MIEKYSKKTSQEALQSKKKYKGIVLYTLILALLIVPIVYALEMDNVKNYDTETQTVTFKKTLLGVPTTEIGKAQLLTPHRNIVMPSSNETDYRLVAKFKITVNEDYNSFWKQVEFINNWNGKATYRELFYKRYVDTGKTRTVKDFELDCKEITIKEVNGTSCTQKLKGTHEEKIYEWQTLKDWNLKTGTYEIGLFSLVYNNDNIEFIPTIAGIKTPEFAVWESSMNVGLVAAWNWSTYNDILGNINLTNNSDYHASGDVPIVIDSFCKLGNNCLNFSDGALLNGILQNSTVMNGASFGTNSRSMACWVWVGDINDNAAFGYGRTDLANSVWQTGADTTDWKSFGYAYDYTWGTRSSSSWQLLGATYNGTDNCAYINGTLDACTARAYDTGVGPLVIGGPTWTNTGYYWDGYIDDCFLWNRTLTSTEMSDLWNNGLGLQYNEIEPDLEVPLFSNYYDNTETLVDSGVAIFNVTILNTNGTAFIQIDSLNYTVQNLTANVYNFTAILANGSYTYYWGAWGNGTSHVYNTSALRYFNVNMTRGYIYNSETYASSTYETARNNFILNISYNPSYYSSAVVYLVYNGTSYLSTKNGTGSNNLFLKALDTPLLPSNLQVNKTFYWDIRLYNGTGIDYYNTSIKNQSINPIIFTQCNATYSVVALNFSGWDEANGTRINPFNFGGTFNYGIYGGSALKNISIQNTTGAEHTFCINPTNQNYTVDASILFGGLNYVDKNYYINDLLTNNVTQHIKLYTLSSGAGTTVNFIIKVQDEALTAVANAYVYIYRYNAGTGSYDLVDTVLTDDNGKSASYFQINTVRYHFVIKKDGVTLLTTGDQLIIPEEAPYTLTFTVGNIGNPMDEFLKLTGVTSTLTYNPTTKIVSYGYTSINESFVQGRLLVYRTDTTNSSTMVCNVTSTLATAALECNVTSDIHGIVNARGYITHGSTEFLDKQMTWDTQDMSGIFGTMGLFIGFFLIVAAAFAFLWSIAAGVIAVCVVMLLIQVMGLINFGWMWVIGISVIGGFIIWVTRQ